MSERKEPGLNLTGIEVENQPPAGRPAPSAAPQPPQTARPRGGGLLLTLILLLLAAGGAGLAYWTAGLMQTLEAQQAELAQTQARVGELEQLLELTNNSASQAGQTLMGRIAELEKSVAEKQAHFDSEIAKLWTVSYQRNKPQLEEQKKRLEAYQAELAGLQDTLAGESRKLGALDARVAEMAGLTEDLAALEQSLQGLQQQMGQLQKVSDEASFALALERDERQAAAGALSDRLDRLSQQVQGAQALSGRIASMEQSIQAIDGSRRQFSQSLLQLREQLARLQSRVGG